MKRVFCMLLTMVFLFSAVGCGSGQSDTAKTPAAVEETGAQEAASDADSGESQEAAGAQELEFVQLKMIALGDSTADSERFLRLLNEKLKADLNCEMEIEYISWSDWTTKYPLVFASGEEFDLVYTSNWADYADQARKGAFYELTESDRETYMPMTCEALGDTGWDQAKLDGKVYMVPSTPQGYFDDCTCFGVRGDLMKEFGMDSITTEEDMLAYWDNVLDKHPEMVPINMTNTSGGAFGAFLAKNFIDDPYHDTNEEGIPLMTGHQEASLMPVILDISDRANIRYLDQEEADQYFLRVFEKAQELRKKGYWTADALTITEEMDVAYRNGKSASTVRQLSNIEAANKEILQNHPEWEPTIVRFVDYPYYSIPGMNNGMAVHATSGNPERAMMVLDRMGYDQSYYDLMYYGEEGVDYTLDGDGAVTRITNFSDACNMGFLSARERVEASSTDAYVALREEGINNCAIPSYKAFAFDKSPCETECAAMSQVSSKYYPILSLGMSDDVAGTYQEMVEEMKAAGMDVVMEEYLKQIQAFYDAQ